MQLFREQLDPTGKKLVNWSQPGVTQFCAYSPGIQPICPHCNITFASSEALIHHLSLMRYSRGDLWSVENLTKRMTSALNGNTSADRHTGGSAQKQGPICCFCKFPFANSDALIDHLLLTRYNPYSVIIGSPNKKVTSKPAAPAVVAQTGNVSVEHSAQVPNIFSTRLTNPGLVSTLSPILRNSGIENAESISAEFLSFEEIKTEIQTEPESIVPDMSRAKCGI